MHPNRRGARYTQARTAEHRKLARLIRRSINILGIRKARDGINPLQTQAAKPSQVKNTIKSTMGIYRISKGYVGEESIITDNLECCFSSKACMKCLAYLIVIMIILGVFFAIIVCSSGMAHGRCHF
ncbi:hypothetical protein KP509_18G043600 [Ceratopteris richardii]|uniref:Uncharacterized protein n=1 Tax=Ceratopteris richardii TaxID=49495 RepID=A0A8T2SQQ1_CERRI|nr:hypothetical protein KP509_18G043600 [Ceratopteris richardii]